MSKEQQQVFSKSPEIQEFLIKREMTKAEFYDEKLHIYIFEMLEPQIKGSFNFGIDFIQLGKFEHLFKFQVFDDFF